MSEPTYRITTERTAMSFQNPWEARVVRLADGEPIYTGYGASEGEALAVVTAMLRPDPDERPGAVYFADEDGNLMDTPPISPDSRRVA